MADVAGDGPSRTRDSTALPTVHDQEEKLRHSYIERALGEASKIGEADTVADATVQALQALFADLATFIANDAVRALCLRSLHLSLLFFDRPAQASPSLDVPLAELRKNLAIHQPADARRAAQALLESLVALIGQPLTMRLVASAWGSPVELNGDLRRVMAVVKVRNCAHSPSLRLFDITDIGLSIGEAAPEMQALLSGHPRLAAAALQPPGHRGVKAATPPSGGAPGSPGGLPDRESAIGQREEAIRLREQAVQTQSAALSVAQMQQQELREANAHLVLAKLEADALKEAAELARKRQDEFLATLAHELRIPLAPISNAAALLARADCNPDMLRRILGTVDRQIHQLARLVDQLLDVSRVKQGRIELLKQPATVSGIVEQAVQTHRALIKARHQQLQVNMPVQSLVVPGGPVRLVQVVGNLLNNAAKYTREGGAITVTARQKGDAVLIEVQDTGTGIGIAALPALAHTELIAQPIQQSPRAQGTERVLVIEDNADAAETLAMVLRFSGYEEETAPGGPSGLAMAAQLRLRGDEPPLMIALTGYGTAGDIARALSADFHQHMAKPADVEKLLQVISKVLHPKDHRAPR